MYDMVKAAIANGSAKYVTITRSGSGGGGGTITGSEVELTANPTEADGGQMIQVTATVTNLSGEGPLRENVILTIPVNNSEGSFVNDSGASVNTITLYIDVDISTASGSVTYRTGTKNNTLYVEDLIIATLGNGSTDSVIVTRNATSTGGADYISSLNANPSLVTDADRLSVINATVSHWGTSGTIADQTIKFTIPLNNTGASFINKNGERVPEIQYDMKLDYLSDTTVSVTYEAGSSGTAPVDDMIQAELGNGSTRAVIVTRD